MEAELTAGQLRDLFVLVSRALPLSALRLKPRERQLAGLLSSESFGNGRASGVIGISIPVQGKTQTGKWVRRLDWRASEIWSLFAEWRRDGWIMVDWGEGVFRFCPEKLPGWAEAVALVQADSLGQNQQRVSPTLDSFSE